MKTYCNPLPIPDYPIGRNAPEGGLFWRELADLREKARRTLKPDASSKFEEKDTKGIDIRGRRRQFAANAFGSEGVWRAEIHREGRCSKGEPVAELWIEDARDAEVG